jgi:hypothetical protein
MVDGVKLFTGSGLPAMPAPPGSVYIDVTGGILYYKGSSGPVSTDGSGWVPLTGLNVSGSIKIGAAVLTDHPGVPIDGLPNYPNGSLCCDTVDGDLYVNAGNSTSATWKKFTRAT